MKNFLLLVFLLPTCLAAQRDTIFGLDGRPFFQEKAPPGDLISPADSSPVDDHFRRVAEKLSGQPFPVFEYRDALGQPVFSDDFSRQFRLFYVGDIWHDPCLVHFEALKILADSLQKSGPRIAVFTSNEASQFGERLDPKNYPFPFLVNAGATVYAPETGSEGGYPRLLFIDQKGLIQRVDMMISGKSAAEIAGRWQLLFAPLFNQK